MPYVLYSLDNAINSFFENAGASTSKVECDAFALQRCGGQVRPVNIQGVTSYTVTAGPNDDKIIRFREQSALLNIDMLALAKDIHGEVVPSCSEIGHIGDPGSDFQLVIYEMNRLPGENYVIARSSLAHKMRLNTIHGLARFFAQSWRKGISEDSRLLDISTISTECYTMFEYMVETLPERFLPTVTEVQAALSSLLDGCYPVVLTHSDLNGMNILVDPNSGEITGIVDWSLASVQPFGFSLYALEDALGNMGSSWEWFEDADYLRDTFWRTFQDQTGVSEAQIKLAKLAGKASILIRYGTVYESGCTGLIGARDPKDDEYRYLDALLPLRALHLSRNL